MLGQLDPACQKVHVIGAGISGLLAGYYLQKAGYQVTVFEKNARAGGLLGTQPTPAGLVETAANAVYANEAVLKLLQELGLKPLETHPQLKRFIWRNGKPRAFPLTFKEVLTVGLKLFKQTPSSACTVKDFFLPLLGPTLCDEVLSPTLSGIYALPCEQLHFASLFTFQSGRYLDFLKQRRKRPKARSISFAGGMQELIDSLTKTLTIHYETPGVLSPEVNTVICTNAHQAAALLQDSRLSPLLRQIEYLSLQTSTYFLKTPLKFLEQGFGVLFPRGSGFHNLGLLHNSAIFPKRTSSSALRSYTFISDQPGEHHQQVLQDFKKLGLPQPEIVEKQHTVWEQALPQYTPKRSLILKKLKKHMPTKSLLIFGNYSHAISLRELIQQAQLIAR